MSNSDTVREMYAAFGRGDVPAILEKMADDVEWEYVKYPTNVPWLQQVRGKEGVMRFFEALQLMDFHRFEPTEILEGNNVVVALIQLETTVKATGRKIVETDEGHIWRFNNEGKVQSFAHRVDSHQHWLAYNDK